MVVFFYALLCRWACGICIYTHTLHQCRMSGWVNRNMHFWSFCMCIINMEFNFVFCPFLLKSSSTCQHFVGLIIVWFLICYIFSVVSYLLTSANLIIFMSQNCCYWGSFWEWLLTCSVDIGNISNSGLYNCRPWPTFIGDIPFHDVIPAYQPSSPTDENTFALHPYSLTW